MGGFFYEIIMNGFTFKFIISIFQRLLKYRMGYQ